MSYKALYRAYRPLKFDDIQGQRNIVKTLKNIIKNDKIGHAYLFSGPRGTGKTSMAQIFARTINCKDISDDLVPCGKCNSCLESLSNKSLDIIEIDAASNNGVNEIRELRESIKFAPSISEYKVYIVDEVHMLSKGAFNALLKTLEEPPVHSIFILATTEPEKIPMTILSRCQRFNFKRISTSDILSHLKFVLDKEDIKYDEESLALISHVSDGGLRDALSIADQVSAFGNGKITVDSISRVFGLVSKLTIIDLFNMLYKGNASGSISLLDKIFNNGADSNSFLKNSIEVIKEFIIYKKTGNKELLSFLIPEEVDKLEFNIEYAYTLLDELVSLLSKTRNKIDFNLLVLSLIKVANKEKDEEENTNMEDSYEVEEESNDEEQEINEEASDLEEVEKTLDMMLDNIQESTTEITNEVIATGEIEVEEEVNPLDMDDYINLLVSASNKDDREDIKNRFSNLSVYYDHKEYGEFVELFQHTNFITANDAFILLMSPEGVVKRRIDRYINGEKLNLFLKEVFGSEMNVYVVGKELWNDIKNHYRELKENNNLPSPRPIESMSTKDESDEKKHVKSLFGDLMEGE